MGQFSRVTSKISTAHYARAVLKKIGITAPPVNVKEIILNHYPEILLKEDDFSDEFDGCIIQKDGKALLCLNSNIQYEGRKNFTLAHELGHFTIPHHDRMPKCHKHDLNTFDSVKAEEAEANEFATELLMPENWIKSIIEEKEIGIKTAQELAETFQTSLISTAHRYIEFSLYAAALVLSENKSVKYVRFSKELYRYHKHFLGKGNPLNRSCVAVDCFNATGNVASSQIRRATQVLPSVWFDSLDSSMANCYEEAMGFPNLGMALSFVWIEEKNDEINDDSYDED